MYCIKGVIIPLRNKLLEFITEKQLFESTIEYNLMTFVIKKDTVHFVHVTGNFSFEKSVPFKPKTLPNIEYSTETICQCFS